MIPGVVIHALIALVWMFLSGSTTLGGLVIGLLAGFALMALFQKALGCQNYIRRMLAVIGFAGNFLKEVVESNLRIARVALRRDAGELRGEFLAYPVGDLTDFEILLLSQCISLTPGTIVVEKNAGTHELILHSFASGSPDEIRRSLDEGLKRNILSFTR